MMKNLMGIQVGGRYLFMTVTFYWDGIVEALYPTHAMLRDCKLVKDVGDNPNFDTWASADKMPDLVWVPIPNVQIIQLAPPPAEPAPTVG